MDYILNVYYKDMFKEFCLPNYMNGQTSLFLFHYETGENYDILLSLIAVNGIWKLQENDSVNFSVYKNDGVITKNQSYQLNCLKSRSLIVINTKSKDNVCFDFLKYHCDGMKEITIGRDSGNIISIANDNASSCHAVIQFADRKTYIEDNDSKNGVYVNGFKIKRSRLRFGDIVYISGVKILCLGNILALNSPDNHVTTRLYEYIKNLKSINTEDSSGVFDNQTYISNYFMRSPQISKKIKIIKDEIEATPLSHTVTPQPLLLTIGPSLTMGIAMLAGLVFTIYATSNSPSSVIPGAVSTIAMLVGAIIWPIAMRNYQLKQQSSGKIILKDKYKKYVESIREELASKQAQNKSSYNEIYPAVEECFRICTTCDRRLWERTPAESYFLDIRIGIGHRLSTIEVVMPKDRFTVEDDPFRNEILEIADRFKYIKNVPVSISLIKYMTGVIGENHLVKNVIQEILVQLATLHSYDEVKICFVCNESTAYEWSWIKYLPHNWDNKKSTRFFSSNIDEMRSTLAYINDIVTERKEGQGSLFKEKKHLPHYVIFIMDSTMANEPIVKKMIDIGNNASVSFVFAGDSLRKIPNDSNLIVQCTQNEHSIFDKDDESGKMFSFFSDSMADFDFLKYVKAMTKIEISSLGTDATMPDIVTFLDLYNVTDIRELAIEKRWSINQTAKTMEVPIGIATDNKVFCLNVHEKHHGPHGLIAGMTGSGKSEFIQTFILSLVVNYSPYELSFMLIDYKGGGMANSFAKLPHVVGTITNLNGNQIHRSLVSLKSELKRRQQIFAKVGVNHIDKYQETYKRMIDSGQKCEPLPKLLIIADEFAELKKDQPDFMYELVSAARIGRSLGVFLILATQRPSGVVDEQIWSNTRFRVCLKVLDKGDSNEMLKQPDAAGITLPGRCYVQVGNNEIFELVQSGWSDAPYLPGKKLENMSKYTVNLINNVGECIESATIKKEVTQTKEKQLGTIVSYIHELSESKGIKMLPMWKEPLKTTLSLEQCNAFKNNFDGKQWNDTTGLLNPVIGIFDDPSAQTQDSLSVDISEHGHVAIFGAPGSGKTTFFETLLYSIATNNSPENVNVYILDFGGRTLGNFSRMPHVGDIIFSDDEEKLQKVFAMLRKEIARRKKLFAEAGVGNLKSYIEAVGKTLPFIMLVIDNFPAFNELFNDYVQEVTIFSRDGGNYGLTLLLSGNSSSSINYKIMQNIKLIYALNLNDKYDYVSLVGNLNGMEPENIKGRGVVKFEYPVEFQTALAIDAGSDAKRAKHIQTMFNEMDEAYTGLRPKKINVLSEVIPFNEFFEQANEMLNKDFLPIGIDTESGDPLYIDLSKILTYQILGHELSGKTNLLRCLEKFVIDNEMGSVYFIDETMDAKETNAILYKIFAQLKERRASIKELEEDMADKDLIAEKTESFEKIFVFIDNFEIFFEKISSESMENTRSMVKDTGELKVNFFFTATPSKLGGYKGQSLYENVFTGREGLLLGGRYNSQIIFGIDIDYNIRTTPFNSGIGYFISGNSYQIIKAPFLQETKR